VKTISCREVRLRRCAMGTGTGSQCAHPGLISAVVEVSPQREGAAFGGRTSALHAATTGDGSLRRNSSLPRPVRLCSATFASSRRIGRLTVMVKATRVASNPSPPASGDCGPLLARPSVTERQPMACVAQSEVLLASIAAGVTLFPAVHAGSRSSTSPGPGLLPPSTAPASSRPSRSWGKRGRLLDADGRASRERRFRRELTGFQGGGT
jgi:hypothetical protein